MSQEVVAYPVSTQADSALQAAVTAALKANARVPSARVTVAAHDGTVTLAGHVNWKYESAAAVGAAAAVDGVRTVDNQIVVDVA